MVFNQDAEGRFSAIAASFNPAFERDCPAKQPASAPEFNVRFI